MPAPNRRRMRKHGLGGTVPFRERCHAPLPDQGASLMERVEPLSLGRHAGSAYTARRINALRPVGWPLATATPQSPVPS
jgi:hypothetical protein